MLEKYNVLTIQDFKIMTGENWTDILYDAMHSQEHASVAYAAIFMVFLYFAIHCKKHLLMFSFLKSTFLIFF
jgi:hypothetical protein